MRKILWVRLVCWMVLAAWTGSFARAAAPVSSVATAADASITVQLSSGRTFAATLDRRTDAERLWLRFGEGRIEILRPVDWGCVVAVAAAGHELSGVEFRQAVEQVRKEMPVQASSNEAKTNIVMVGAVETEQPEVLSRASEVAEGDSRRVVTLAIDARMANWDETAEADGLLVRIYPLDAQGMVVPVRGTLSVDLKAEQNGLNHVAQPFIEIGRWSEMVRPTDFGVGGAIYPLRFQGIHPEYERSIRPIGSVSACLTVPGQGTFKATADSVSLRSK